MVDVIQRPSNSLSAMRRAATALLTAYKVSQAPYNDNVKAESLCLEALELAKCAIELLRRGK